MDFIARWAESSVVVTSLVVALPVVGAALIPFGQAWSDNGDRAFLLGGICCLVAFVVLQVVVVRLNRGVAIRARGAVATLRAAYKDALTPIAEQLADMPELSEGKRRRQFDMVLKQACSALSLLFDGVDDVRVVVYLVDNSTSYLRLNPEAYSRAREGRTPKPFVQGSDRGNAALQTLFQDEPCFVNDVDDPKSIAATTGAYAGTREGYKAFISVSIYDAKRRYGLLAVDTPARNAFSDTDKYLVGLIADLLAVGAASVRNGLGIESRLDRL